MKDNKANEMAFSCCDCNHKEIPILVESKRGEMVAWGERNDYPQYLWYLYLNNPILGSIINSISDFICGDAILNGEREANNDGETMSDIVRKLSYDINIFGGFALQILRNADKEISEIYVLDFRKVRTNVDGSKIFYNPKFGEFSFSAKDTQELDAYDGEKEQKNSVFFFKGFKTRDTYPIPPYFSAIKQIETGIRIGNFHLNAISNGLSSNYLINFNNGTPTEEVRRTIERKITDKFTGDESAGTPMIAWNKSKESAVTIEKIPQDDFDKKYEALASNVIDSIAISMRCSPVLIGMNPKNTGFSQTEYKELYSIFNKTTIQPLQRQIVGALRKIFGYDVVTIVPYNIADVVAEETTNEEVAE